MKAKRHLDWYARASDPKSAKDSALLALLLILAGLFFIALQWLFLKSLALCAGATLIAGIPVNLWIRTGSPLGDLRNRRPHA